MKGGRELLLSPQQQYRNLDQMTDAIGSRAVQQVREETMAVGRHRGQVHRLLFGDASQFIAQLIGVTVNLVVVFGLALTFFVIVDRTIGNRVPAEVEWTGLDALEMGSDAYPNV